MKGLDLLEMLNLVQRTVAQNEKQAVFLPKEGHQRWGFSFGER